MNILLVQASESDNYSYKTLFDQVLKIKEQQQVDLVIFPERLAIVEGEEEGWDFVKYTSYLLKTPVVCGLTYYDGSERALYVNGDPASGETAYSFFAKQSTKDKFAFEMDKDVEDGAKKDGPILLNGYNIQVHMGTDAAPPLTLQQENVDIVIYRTGGNVDMSQWYKGLKEQSAELDAIVLCSMAKKLDKQQPSEGFGFKSGERLKANYKVVNGETGHAFGLFSLNQLLFENEVVESITDIHKLQ